MEEAFYTFSDLTSSAASASASYSTAADYFRTAVQEQEKKLKKVSYDDDFGASSFPLHDALIAAFMPAGSRDNPQLSVSTEEVEEMLQDCSMEEGKNNNNDDLVTRFREGIPSIIDKAINLFDTNTGRILETSNQQMEIGDNYYATIKSASLSCFVSASVEWNMTIPAAYSSYIVAPLDSDTVSPSPMAYEHNLTMFIEADVMEMPSNMLYYIPKRYCFDGLDLRNHQDISGMSGISNNIVPYLDSSGIPLGFAPLDRIKQNKNPDDDAAFLDTMPNDPTATSYDRNVAMGQQAAVLKTRLNRLGRAIAWAHKIQEYKEYGRTNPHKFEWDLLVNAYRNPKAELLAARQGDLFGRNHICSDITKDLGKMACFQTIIGAILDRNMKPSLGATVAAWIAFETMNMFSGNWTSHLQETYREKSPEEIEEMILSGSLSESQLEEELEIMKRIRYPVPYIFDRKIAASLKNTALFPIQANPYSEGSRVEYPSDDPEETQKRTECNEQGNSSSATVGAANKFLSALMNRFESRNGEPMKDTKLWKYYNFGAEEMDINEGLT